MSTPYKTTLTLEQARWMDQAFARGISAGLQRAAELAFGQGFKLWVNGDADDVATALRSLGQELKRMAKEEFPRPDHDQPCPDCGSTTWDQDLNVLQCCGCGLTKEVPDE